MRYLLAAPALLLATTVQAAPFTECPSKAFLTQGSVPGTYGVDLATGDFQVLAQSMGVKQSVNGLGFNPNDRFLYGWSYEHWSPARIHSDFSVEALPVENIGQTNFYVGDVREVDNTYYVYRRGSSGGLYSIGLDETQADYLKMTKITDGVTINLRIADMAFHPGDTYAYAVDNQGAVHQIDVDAGTAVKVGDSGITGTFGAAYFDPEGNLYVSRNNDGAIHRIAINSGDYTAEFFAKGPASGTNDGSRCANAPVFEPSAKFDFGDAPDSYGTTLDNNGARHGMTSSDVISLGSLLDGESDAYVYPLSDEETGDLNDDDGVQFATNIVESSNTIVKINASSSGYLSAWIDLNRDGEFNGSDQVLRDYKVEAGSQMVYMTIPAGVSAGDSWARFRLSSVNGLQAVGGAPDGEVEDYKVALVEAQETVTHYPNSNGWTTLSFEDNWPYEGDYDMNDLVVHMRTAVAAKPGGVTRVKLKGQVAAVGAAYHNGFAVRLPGVMREQVDVDNIKYEINGQPVDFQPLENDREEAIFIVTYNIWDHVGTGEHCKYYRTESGCGSDIQMNFAATIPMKEPVQVKLKGALDPFLFATPGAWHGGHFVTAPGRAYEIHLKNYAPTEAFDQSLFSAPGDDSSEPVNGYYYQTSNGLPWALEIGTYWSYPLEYQDIGHAYPMFANWAESNGWLNKNWYLLEHANAPMLFDN